jgi:lambda family phage portal protein
MAYLRILDSRGNKIPVSAQSAFEGARAGRRLGSWMASTSGINSLISGSINNLRSRSRHLRRNNPLTDGGVDSFVSDLIGTGISPSWQLKDQNLKKTIQELWNDWTEEADYTGTCDFYGLQSLVSQALIESGEALVRIKPQSVKSDLSVPLQLQVLEGDHLDENYSTTLANGNSIRMGIEFDGDGKRVAYHLWPEHPGENYGFSRSLTRIRVPAEEICHVYRSTRPGRINRFK